MRDVTIDSAQLGEFEAKGFLTLPAVADERELADANDAFEKVYVEDSRSIHFGWAACIFDERILRLATSPTFERIAQQVLLADEVELFTVMARVREPEPGAQRALEWEHIDCRYSMAQLTSVPRDKICAIYLWLTDMTPERAPLMVRPGSHWKIAQTVTTEDGYIGDPIDADQLPDLGYEDYVMVTTKAGDVTLLETACIHSGSTNRDTKPRRVLVAGFRPRGSAAANGEWFAQRRQAFQEELRQRLPADRRHLAVGPDAVRY